MVNTMLLLLLPLILFAEAQYNSPSNQGNGDVFDSSVTCARNGYFEVNGSCDEYISCRENVPSQMVCPDGLNFNPAAVFPDYPCSYPMDVPCKERSAAKLPRPTSECPRQYGYFPLPLNQEGDCGKYKMCIEGRAIEMSCPFGLAFNPEIAQCEWPENVPVCNVNEYLGFVCPPAAVDGSGNPIVTYHRYEGECYSFFSCLQGKPHLLSCDLGLAFDAAYGRCRNSDLVQCHIKAEHL